MAITFAIKRIKRAIQDMQTGGMQTGKQHIKLEYSNAQRAIAEIEALQSERDALEAQVEALKDAANFAYCNWRSSSDVIGGMRRLVDAVDSTPAQCLAEIRAEAGRAGFIAGAATGHAEGYDYGLIRGENPTGFDFSDEADQYAEQIRKGEL